MFVAEEPYLYPLQLPIHVSGWSPTRLIQGLCQGFVSYMLKVRGSCRTSSSCFNLTWGEYRCGMKPNTGGDFMKCTHCMRFCDILHGAPGIRMTVEDGTRAQVEEGSAAHHEVGWIRLVLVPRDDALLISCRHVALCARRFHSSSSIRLVRGSARRKSSSTHSCPP